jgi:uncharacterized membrane protein
VNAAAPIVILGLSVSLVDFRLVLPHFSGGSPYDARLTGVGGSPGGVVTTAFSHPLAIVDRLFAWPHLLDLGLLLVPVLALCLQSALILAAVPQLAFVLLSARFSDGAPWSQNVLPIAPFIFAGAAFALANPRMRKWRAGHVLAASIGCAAFFGPLGPYALPSVYLRHVQAERRAVSLVPPSAAVSVTNHLGAHLAARRYLYVFPVTGTATWIVLDRSDAALPNVKQLKSRHGLELGVMDLPWQPTLMKQEIRKIEGDPRWRPVFSDDGVMVFKRRST